MELTSKDSRHIKPQFFFQLLLAGAVLSAAISGTELLPIIVIMVLNLESLALLYLVKDRSRRQHDKASDSNSSKLNHLWSEVQGGMRENRFLRAEKALLTILKIDERNAAAYNRLGILYAKQKEYRDAIDCFEIASSIEPTASAFHNLGLIYYEIGDYKKSKRAFEQALKMEDGIASRHIAYAKVQEKLGKIEDTLIHLRKAYDIEPNKDTFLILCGAYEFYGMKKELRTFLKAHTDAHPEDIQLAAMKYGLSQLAEVAEKEENAVNQVIARHKL